MDSSHWQVQTRVDCPAGTKAIGVRAHFEPYAYGSYPDIDELFQQQAVELDHKKRAATLEKMQQLVYDRSIYAPIWLLGFLNGVGPRVGESGFELIPGYAYTAPYEDITLKGA